MRMSVLDTLPVKGLLPLFAALLILPTTALAQDAPADAWVKMCNTDKTAKKELCMTLQEVRADTGQPIVSASIRQVTGQEAMSLFVAVPTGMQLQPGLRFAVDDAAPLEVPYGVCFPNACYAEIEAKPDLVDALKNGSQIVVTTFNQAGKSMTFPMSLAGFTKAFESKGLDAEEAQKRQEELNKLLQEKAKKAQELLIEQQKKGTDQPN